MPTNKYIILQFDKKVFTSVRNFTKDDLVVIIQGVNMNNKALRYDVSAVVGDSFSSKG